MRRARSAGATSRQAGKAARAAATAASVCSTPAGSSSATASSVAGLTTVRATAAFNHRGRRRSGRRLGLGEPEAKLAGLRAREVVVLPRVLRLQAVPGRLPAGATLLRLRSAYAEADVVVDATVVLCGGGS